MSQILIIRHGQASFGAKDYDKLSERGHIQSAKLGQWLSKIGLRPTRIVTGGLRRHDQTAEMCLTSMKLRRTLEIDPSFAEYDHLSVIDALDPHLRRRLMEERDAGIQTDMNAFSIQFAKAVARWVSGNHDQDYRETHRDFAARVRSGLSNLTSAAQQDETVFVFTSGGPMAMLYRTLTGVETLRAFDMGHRFLNTSIMRLSIRDETPNLLSLNGVPHLELARDPTLFTFI